MENWQKCEEQPCTVVECTVNYAVSGIYALYSIYLLFVQLSIHLQRNAWFVLYPFACRCSVPKDVHLQERGSPCIGEHHSLFYNQYGKKTIFGIFLPHFWINAQ